jgi:hypothetical protein
VVQTLAAAGLDTTAVGDPLTGTLAAGSGSGYDGVLDTLGSTLASSGATLATLTATVAANSPASTSATSTTASSSEAATTSLLPAALLLKPKAASRIGLPDRCRAGDRIRGLALPEPLDGGHAVVAGALLTLASPKQGDRG